MLKAITTVGGMTLISRVLGFIRDILIAAFVGAGPIADAFFVAFRFPNFFRRLFAEGAFNAAMVPLFSRKLEGEGHAAAKKFAEEVLVLLILIVLALILVSEIFMPEIMLVLAPGFEANPEKFDLAVQLTRITMPYLLFMALMAMYAGILNSFQKFAAAAAAPILLNIVLISVLLGFIPVTGHAGHALSWGVFVAGILQFVSLVWAAHGVGMNLRLRVPRLTDDSKRLLKLIAPGALAAGIVQVNLLIGTIIASLQDGAVSWLYYADRIYQLPLGVVGIAIGVVLLPELSRKLKAEDRAGAMYSMNRAMEFSLLLTLPAAAALMVIPHEIIRTLFQHGVFSATDTSASAKALAAFATGLPAFVLIKVLSPPFFAREDTRTPFYFATVGVAVNISLSLILFYQIGYIGIAMATAIAAWINAGLLFFRLRSLSHYVVDPRLKSRFWRLLLSCLGMVLTLLAIQFGLDQWRPIAIEPAKYFDMAGLIFMVVMGATIYSFCLIFTGAAQWSDVTSIVKRRQI